VPTDLFHFSALAVPRASNSWLYHRALDSTPVLRETASVSAAAAGYFEELNAKLACDPSHRPVCSLVVHALFDVPSQHVLG